MDTDGMRVSYPDSKSAESDSVSASPSRLMASESG